MSTTSKVLLDLTVQNSRLSVENNRLRYVVVWLLEECRDNPKQPLDKALAQVLCERALRRATHCPHFEPKEPPDDQNG